MSKLVVLCNVVFVVVIISLSFLTFLFDIFGYIDGESLLYTIIDVVRLIIVMTCSLLVVIKHSKNFESTKVLGLFLFITIYGYFYYSLWVAVVGILGGLVFFKGALKSNKDEFYFTWNF